MHGCYGLLSIIVFRRLLTGFDSCICFDSGFEGFQPQTGVKPASL